MEKVNCEPFLRIMDSSFSWTRGKGDTGHFWRCRIFSIGSIYWLKGLKCPIKANFMLVMGSNPMMCTDFWSWVQTPHSVI